MGNYQNTYKKKNLLRRQENIRTKDKGGINSTEFTKGISLMCVMCVFQFLVQAALYEYLCLGHKT
jgi:hypothetical protein